MIQENGSYRPPDLVLMEGSPRAGWYWNLAAMYWVAIKFTTTSSSRPNTVARQL
jgi:hypothetical protein